MTRLDTARETAGRTMDTLAPYAATARDTATHYADEARQRLGPALEALGPRVEAAACQARTGTRHAAHSAAHSARSGYSRHLAPHVGQAFTALPPRAQENTLRAVHRAQEAALAAKHSADRAGDYARTTTLPRLSGALDDAKAAAGPALHEAQSRGAAALIALQGNVSPEEVSKLAAKNARRARCNALATSLAVAGAVAVGGGVLIWAWWHKRSEPEWLVEPPEVQGPPTSAHPGTAPLNGSGPTEESDQPLPGEDAQQGDGHPKPHDPRKPH
ncbi:DUF5324 family protein [Kitasatospora sp. NBC_01250]|uniref:DUF5324 family protein n=1 Tax=unclassified Kitasatospora TaxID=2633591 RepID=UPI002E11DF63|nr:MULTISPECIES: DUF5324 family protein [unclassified Kitasatospora]WSJ68349.1 DUF5324 family protein [Kitasatospora sp. NBC_01302]